MHAIYMRRWVQEGTGRANSPPLIYYIFIFSANLLIDANLTIDWGEKPFLLFLILYFQVIAKLFKNHNFLNKTFFFLHQLTLAYAYHGFINLKMELKKF